MVRREYGKVRGSIGLGLLQLHVHAVRVTVRHGDVDALFFPANFGMRARRARQPTNAYAPDSSGERDTLTLDNAVLWQNNADAIRTWRGPTRKTQVGRLRAAARRGCERPTIFSYPVCRHRHAVWRKAVARARARMAVAPARSRLSAAPADATPEPWLAAARQAREAAARQRVAKAAR